MAQRTISYQFFFYFDDRPIAEAGFVFFARFNFCHHQHRSIVHSFSKCIQIAIAYQRMLGYRVAHALFNRRLEMWWLNRRNSE